MIPSLKKCVVSQIILVFLLGSDSFSQSESKVHSQTLHGLEVAAEDRCSLYDRDDYRYSQSVEQRIVDKQGGIFSPYDMQCFKSTSETDIEHIVAISEAHDSGLCNADAETRRSFAGDLDNLTLARPKLNRHVKGAFDAGEWLPQNNQCWYAHSIIRVKRTYSLTVDSTESATLDKLLMECGKDSVMVKPSCPVIKPRRNKCGPYANCTALRRDHPSGVSRSHCAYQSKMDRDKDGWACEK